MPVRAASLGSCLILLGSPAAFGQKGGGVGPQFLPRNIPPPVADATTDEQLRERQNRERGGELAPKEQKAKTLGLAETSTFIETAGMFTIVPKGAVIHIPEKLAAWIVPGPSVKAKFQTWQEFLTANRGSVASFEITFDQASGKIPIDSSKLDLARKSGRLVVAVCHGGPISCVPLGGASQVSTP
ncbi:hypothetical protein [Luteolibacter sp. LG18]|uniref:hypothetical protein n=1 Tax=Luteolibacter sp. LG18 TaxID=2819286 RepID=UPI002B2E6E33|nr:hypothetical protein llg_01100 [Luteolibacter sp. LG18]